MKKERRKYRITHFLFCLLFVVAQQANSQFIKSKKQETSREQLQDAEYYFSEGMKEYIIDNFPKALSAFEKSAGLKRDNAAANYMIAQIYVKQGTYYKAIQYSEKSIEIDPSNKYYYLLLAQIYERKQDFSDAAKVYQNLLKKVPNTQDHYYDLAAVYLFQGKLDDAVKCYDKIEKYYGVTEEVSKQKQQIFLKQNKLNDAIAEGKKLIEAFPDDSRHLISLVELLITNEKLEEAEKLISDLLKKEPANPYANLALSDIYKSKGNLPKAKEKLEQAFKSADLDIDVKVGILIGKVRQLPNEEIKEECLSLGRILVAVHPYDAKSYAMYADILVLSGKSDDALDNYLKSVRLDNTHFKIWQQVVMLDQELNKMDSLKIHSEKALELFPTQSVFWYYNGLAYQLKSDFKKASVSFEEGKKLSSNDKNLLMQFNILLGDSYNGLKEYKKSDDAFEEVLKDDSNNHIVLNNYSYYLSLRKDKLEYARKMSEKVIKEYPDNATYLDTYAWILYVMKDFGKAKDIFEKIADKTNNGTIIEHYGDVLFQLGQKDKALEQWKKAKSTGDASELIDKKIADKKLYEQ